MKRPVVIGYGNPLRQDDGMGWRAAELLEEKLAPGTADITECHQLTPELAAMLAGAPLVLFLDAAVNDVPGSVRYQPVDPQPPSAWSHHLSPGQLLALSEQVNGSAPAAFLVSGGALRTDIGDGLTPLAEQCAVEMASLAGELLAKWNPAKADAVTR